MATLSCNSSARCRGRRRSRLSTFLLVATAALLLPAAIPGAAGAENQLTQPRRYYLALGDSLTFGFQADKMAQELATGTYDPASFTSFADTFAYGTTLTGLGLIANDPSLSSLNDDVTVVNLSCAGETAQSFVSVAATGLYGGPCPYHLYQGATHLALHNDYPDTESQLDAAVAFLRAHPGKVSPITLNIGTNELNRLFAACQLPGATVDCVSSGLPVAIGEVRASLDVILTRLREAAPYADIFVLNLADPYTNLPPAAVIDPAFIAMNQYALEPVIAAHGDHLIDLYTRVHQFSLTETCTYLLICADGDVHPTDVGYAYLGQFVWARSGYAALLPAGQSRPGS